MSVKVMSLVWERAPYKSGTLLVLLALADWSDDEGACWPSINSIAAKARLARRNVQYAIRKLQNDGIIGIDEGGHGRSHQHCFQIRVQRLHLLSSVTKGAKTDTERVQSATERVQPIAPDPLVDPSLDPPRVPAREKRRRKQQPVAYENSAQRTARLFRERHGKLKSA